ncbi:MAG: retention module-containing protein, partial [Shewanella sp.]
MGSVITSKKGLLKLVNGQINVEVDGSNQPAKDGEQLPKGAVLHIDENATYEITFDDGTKLSNEIAPDETAAAIPATGNEAALDEIKALQDLIASGEDPTQGLPETAAGNVPVSDGGSGFISVDRSGAETQAGAGYETAQVINTTALALNRTESIDLPANQFNLAQLTDNFVNGVTYTTSSGLTGRTGDQGAPGSFAYNDGDIITLSIGNVIIAQFSADAILGPILFLQDIAATGLSDVNLNYVENLAILLQALDSDISDGVDDGVLNTNSLINTDSSFANNINILQAIHDALANYIDPTTNAPINMANADKEILSLLLNSLGIIFTRETETSADGKNVFESEAMEHVAGVITDLAGDRAPEEFEARLADTIDVPGGAIEYYFDQLNGQLFFTTDDLLKGAIGQQVLFHNLVVKNVRLSAEFEEVGTLVDLGDGNYVINLKDGITPYDLENLKIDYRVEDWTAFKEVTSSTVDLYKSHLSTVIQDVNEGDGFNSFELISQLTFDTDSQLTINFTSALLSEQFGYPIAEYADDYLVPIQYSNDGGLTWQNMTIVALDYSGSIPRPIFGFTIVGGSNSVLIRVPIFDDSIIEPTEYFRAIVGGDNYYNEEVRFGIIDNDVESDVPSIAINFAIVVEGTPNAVFKLSLSKPSAETITVKYSSEELTALFGQDFINVSGTVTFLPGQTEAFIFVPIVDDFIEEDSPEFALINLFDPTNATLADAQGTLRIFDNDGPDNTAISINVDPITGDNVIDNKDTSETVVITGTVTFDPAIKIGIVILTINGKQYQTLMKADGTFSVEVKASDLYADTDTVVDAKVYGFGNNGAKGTATTTEDYQIALTNDANTVAEDTDAIGNVLTNDSVSNIDSNLSVVSFTVAGSNVVHTAGSSVALEGGSLVINANGAYTFTPNANWNGVLPVITYTTNTGSTATLTIDVTPVNDPSVMVNDTNTVAEDAVATGNVLDNDSDVDSTLTVASFTVAGSNVVHTAGSSVALEGGSLVINADGAYTFTPNANWNGVLPVITYTTNTGSTATLTINVTPVNDDATISVGDADKGTVTEDGSTDNDATTVQMVGGKLDVTDVDNGEAVFQVQTNVTDGNYGSFSIDANGNWTYTLNNTNIAVQSLKAGETLTRDITVTSKDGTDTHTVTITIV